MIDNFQNISNTYYYSQYIILHTCINFSA